MIDFRKEIIIEHLYKKNNNIALIEEEMHLNLPMLESMMEQIQDQASCFKPPEKKYTKYMKLS